MQHLVIGDSSLPTASITQLLHMDMFVSSPGLIWIPMLVHADIYFLYRESIFLESLTLYEFKDAFRI